MKILLTGGHITPALAVADECVARGIEIAIVGRAHAYKLTSETFESKLIKSRNLKLIHLDAGRFSRNLSFQSLLHLLKIPTGFVHALGIVKREHPDSILTFGGYLGLPIAVAGWLLGVPVYTHEQVMVPGVTNRIISNFAKQIFISFNESAEYFPKAKTLLTGNPIRDAVFTVHAPKIAIPGTLPMIYITGGSLGSHALNLHIEAILDKLLKKFVVVHQSGNTPPFYDFDRLSRIKHKNYFVYENVLEHSVGYLFQNASIVISRSGANTVFELIALHKPSVLIPLPYAGFDEQKIQAQILERHHVAEVFHQNGKSEELFKKIVDVYERRDEIEKNFHTLKSYVVPDAAKKIVDVIVRI